MIRRGDKQWAKYDLPLPDNQRDRLANVPRPFTDYARPHQADDQRQEGRKSVEMILGAYQSAQQGRRIVFPL